MASTQQLHSIPACRELRDERAPRRLRALRTFCAVSVAGWLAFAALVSGTPPESLPPDVASALALAEIQALKPAAPGAAPQAPGAAPARPADSSAEQAATAPPAATPRTGEPLKLAARFDLSH
ncbi:hypothetical protein [Aquincola tertiaricarbonis]|uniref:hypothetical protein n=1 Tax=Aquincola tertiaricarbonis TaxID=391953 RepID=UPI0012ED7F8B|nr:hypothetical protein [Aquincola tertiaricarbonis]